MCFYEAYKGHADAIEVPILVIDEGNEDGIWTPSEVKRGQDVITYIKEKLCTLPQ